MSANMNANTPERQAAWRGVVADGFGVPGRFWGRTISDSDRNTVRSSHDGRSYGYQMGATLFRFDGGSGRNEVGIYSSVVHERTGVSGFAGGLLDQYVGRTDPRTAYAGAYWTYLADNGLYVDAVAQHAWYKGHADSAAGNRIDVDGSGMLASVEAGYAIPLSSRFTIEPQVQLVAQEINLKQVGIPNAEISQHSPGTLTGRLGARLVGVVPLGGRTLLPYLHANLWKQFGSTDRTTFSGGAGSTVFNTSTASLYGQAGSGFTIPLRNNVAAYGEGDYRFSLDHGTGAVGNAVSGLVGIKMQL